MKMDEKTNRVGSFNQRREFLKISALGMGAMALSACAPAAPAASGSGEQSSSTSKETYKMSFIQVQPHTVSVAWGQGIEEVASVQSNIEYQQLDGQGDPATQISLMDTAISQGVDVIFCQPADSVALGPSIKKAREAGIPVVTLNIDAPEPHAAHVEMNHYFGAIQIAEKMGEMMGGKGNVVILNAPPGIIIRDMRTNGFVEGMKKYPDIKIIADQSAEWDRKKAQDVLSAILASGEEVNGVYGVNDSMALGAVDVAKSKDLIGKMVIFGNDGEKAALESIEAGELSGTQYTDVWQQGRLATALAIGLATGGISAADIPNQAHLLMPYVIATKENVGSIQAFQRW
jgi:ribose transport system substrate-binding protein